MKRFFSFIAALTILFTVGCDKILESTSLYDKVENIEERLLRLEELCNKMNTNISSLQTIVTALQQNDYVTNIAPITQNGTEVGYTITFSKSGSITIYHGKDGKDGTTPVIGVKQDTDGVYYWTLNGEWLLNERGEKVKAVATDGKDGANGEDGTDGTNGADGKDGKDGITPQLKIEDGYWYISYDNGNSWTQVGKATGEDGMDGSTSVIESIFKEIKQDENSIYLTLVDGTVISIPKTSSYLFDKLQSVSYIPRYTDGKATVFYSSISSSSTEMDFEVSPKDAVADIIAGWQECLSLKAVNTITRTVKYIDMPILSCQADTESGIITISASGCNLSEAFFSGAEGVSARLGISDGNTNITSDFVELVAVKQSVSDRQICYTSTDEKIVEPYDKSVFGANIVSNTYEDGVGVILFDDVVTKIGDNAFLNCQRLKSVTIPNGVTEIGSAPFSCCANLAEFNGKFATADKRAIIANGVFCAYAIRCESTEYSVPTGVTKIGDSAFIYGSWLEKVVIPQGVTEIGEYTFCACNNLQSISIPNSVTTIGYQAFFGCNNNLKSITIPESVTTMGDSVFLDCSVLESVYCKATTPPVATYSSSSWGAFANNAENRKIYVPAASVAAYKAADGWKEYADAIVGYDFEEDNVEDSTEIPNNQIWYTSTDGNIVTPYNADAFGAVILSNTYENGKGIILLNGVVTAIKDFAFLNCKNLANITLPNSLTEIGERSFGACQNLTNIIIPNSLVSIGNWAFEYCESLSNITLSNGVTSIGDHAFYYCKGLTSVTIPDSVTEIGDNPFANCENLAEFKGKFAADNGRCLIIDGVLNSFAPAGLTEYTIPNSVTEIGIHAFSYCSNLTNITIPDSITVIGGYAFWSCSGLTSITIPNGVTTIQEGTFTGCKSLKNITIPENITTIGIGVFLDCSVLESVYCKATTPPVATYSSSSWGAFANNAENRKIYVPAASVAAYKAADGWKEYADAIVGYDFEEDNVEDSTEIPNNQIWYTSTDGNIVTPYNADAFGAVILSNTYENGKGIILLNGVVTAIKDFAFLNCKNLANITLPNSLTEIGEMSFGACQSLTNIIIPDSVTSIGTDAFNFCTSLTSITIPNRVTYIQPNTFRCCEGLINVVIPESVTSIGSDAFFGCISLTNITIPNGVTTIQTGAFAGCKSLKNITIPESVTRIGEQAFLECNLKSVTIPESVTSLGYMAFGGCSVLESVYCKAVTPPAAEYEYSSWHGFANNAENRKIYVPAASVDAYKAADGWKEYADAIVGYDFEEDNVEDSTEIPNNQIWYTSTDGNIVTPYKAEAFGAIILSNTYENGRGVITFDRDLTKLGKYSFSNCDNITTITLPNSITGIGYSAFDDCDRLTSIGFPNSLTKIEEHAFEYCSKLDNITLPNSLVSIGNWAFRYCESLSNITLSNGVTSIGDYAFGYCKHLASITIPDSVTTLGSDVFYGCIGLTSIVIPQNVSRIYAGTFRYCSNLTNVTIPDSVTRIDSAAFGNCSSLTNITIPDSVTTIGDSAFESCSALESVTIGSKVSTIGDGAFRYCYALKNLYCKPTVPPQIYEETLFGCQATICVPKSEGDVIANSYKSADYWKDFATYITSFEF